MPPLCKPGQGAFFLSSSSFLPQQAAPSHPKAIQLTSGAKGRQGASHVCCLGKEGRQWKHTINNRSRGTTGRGGRNRPHGEGKGQRGMAWGKGEGGSVSHNKEEECVCGGIQGNITQTHGNKSKGCGKGKAIHKTREGTHNGKGWGSGKVGHTHTTQRGSQSKLVHTHKVWGKERRSGMRVGEGEGEESTRITQGRARGPHNRRQRCGARPQKQALPKGRAWGRWEGKAQMWNGLTPESQQNLW